MNSLLQHKPYRVSIGDITDSFDTKAVAESKSDEVIPTHLWQEQELKSVANITRRDVKEFLSLAAEMNLQPEIQVFELEQANEALIELHTGKIRGAKVLKVV